MRCSTHQNVVLVCSECEKEDAEAASVLHVERHIMSNLRNDHILYMGVDARRLSHEALARVLATETACARNVAAQDEGGRRWRERWRPRGGVE